VSLNVVICSYLEPELVARISAVDEVNVVYRPDLLPVPRYACDHSAPARDLTASQLNEWRALVAAADVTFDFDWLDPSTIPERSTNLGWIQATSAGIGALMQRTRIDQSNIVVTTARGIHAIPLAEFALLGALYFTKGVPFLARRQREHHWERYTTRQLQGRRALVVGLGGVGREVTRRFALQGVEVWGLGREGRTYEVEGLTRVISFGELDAALSEIDILVVSSPLTSETEGMIGAAQLARLPSDSIVVNISRGQLIDQAALSAALAEGRLAGACLDVFSVEPLPVDDPLWDLDNVLLSPHSASTVATENRDLVTLFLENLDHWRRGEPLHNLYDPIAGY
jgi:phosphoglycerate dehydrogenase-like enzyme